MTKLTHRKKNISCLGNFSTISLHYNLLTLSYTTWIAIPKFYNSWIIIEDWAVILSDTLLNPWEILCRCNNLWCAHESSWEKIMLNNYKCRTYSRLKNKLLPYLTVTVPKIKSCNYLAGYIFNISTTFPLVLEVFQYNCSDDFTFIQSWGKVRFLWMLI